MQRKTIMATVALGVAALAAAAIFPGCTPSTDIGGAPLQNALPDTRITGSPPVLRQTDFIVRFFWTGFDPDGEIKGFQWKISANGPDGISVYDTLTVDPATGDTLHPWFFTTTTDTTFIVTADSSGFAQDDSVPAQDQRFYQNHTLFVRAVDDRGAVDPMPAMMTFTATTLAPTIRLSSPPALATSYRVAQAVPPVVTLRWTGSDPDFELGTPTRVRYLIKSAQIPGQSGYITGRYEYNQYVDQLISFSDPGWSDWIPYGQEEIDRSVTLSFQKNAEKDKGFTYYLFAIQAQDTAGAVSLDRGYARTVHNFYIDNTKRPLLIVRERFLGTYSGVGGIYRSVDIAKNQPLRFEWSGDASSYGGTIAGYRYGWDVSDPDDPDDPGWQVQFGLSEAHRHAPIKTFGSGQHVLLVQCVDNSGLLTEAKIVLSVVPVPSVEDQRPLLLVDGIVDQNSNQWPNQSHTIAYGNDVQRDAFWMAALARSGGVVGFSQDIDVIDLETQSTALTYRRAVNYRSLIWTLDAGNSPVIDPKFQIVKATAGGGRQYIKLPFNWLATYQTDVGNLFLVGQAAVSSFQKNSPQNSGVSWMFPIIFDSTDDFRSCPNGTQRAIGYGIDRANDGTLIVVGRQSYPFASLGLSLLSQVMPPSLYTAGSQCQGGSQVRKQQCVGLKALVLDQDFKERHVSLGALADTIFTWEEVDWDESGDVHDNWGFGSREELYDFNASERSDPWISQTLPDGSPAIEPMWRLYSRYDWILDEHLRNGDTDYPNFDPASVCGDLAINSMTGRTRLDGAPVGFFTYKTVATKPGGKADVVWGFEPVLFDREKMIQAIQWVLGEHFGLPMAP